MKPNSLRAVAVHIWTAWQPSCGIQKPGQPGAKSHQKLVVRAQARGEGGGLERTLRVWMPAAAGEGEAGARQRSEAGRGPAGATADAARRGDATAGVEARGGGPS